MTDPTEIAAVIVNGLSLQNWTSVTVQHRWAEAFHIFEFTTAEAKPAPTSWLQAMPQVGDLVTITLAGIPAIYGPITVRQSAANRQSHGVQLIGKSLSWQFAKSSVRSPTGNYDGYSLAQIAAAVTGQVGVSTKTIGDIDQTPFERMQVSSGEPGWDFLENLCRERRTILGSDEFGKVLLIGSNNQPDDGDAFVEGQNIEEINVVWSNEMVYQNLWAVGQRWGDDQMWGESSAQIEAHAAGIDPLNSQLVVPQEHPDNPGEVAQRAQFEAQWHNGTQLTVTVTVQGWLRSNGDLWRIGNIYHVTAIDHMLDNIALAAKTVTFNQSDDTGTTTTLELVLPWYLNGLLMQDGLPAAPAPGDLTPLGQTSGFENSPQGNVEIGTPVVTGGQ